MANRMGRNKLVHALKNNLGSTARFVSTFADNYLVFSFNKKPSKGPLFIVWTVTGKCNLRCPFCNFRNTGNYAPDDYAEIPYDAKMQIVDNIADAGVWFLSLCGGEPLCCPDTPDVIRHAKSRGLVVNMSTNGLLLEEKAEDITRAGIDFITISLDGHNSELHDSLRGKPGLFAKIEAGIRAVRHLAKKSVYIELRYLINRKNYFHLNDFVKEFSDKVDSLTFKPIYRNSSIGYDVPSDLGFRLEDEADFNEYYGDFLRRNRSFDTTYHRNIPVFLFHPERLRGNFLCFAGTFFGAIDIKGRVLSCHEMTAYNNEPVGDINVSGILNAWRSSKISKHRDALRLGFRCDCWMDRFYLNVPLQKILRPRIW